MDNHEEEKEPLIAQSRAGEAVANLSGGLERAAIKKALLDEAGKWCGDHKISAWRALCDAAKNMGIELTQKECDAALRKRSNVVRVERHPRSAG